MRHLSPLTKPGHGVVILANARFSLHSLLKGLQELVCLQLLLHGPSLVCGSPVRRHLVEELLLSLVLEPILCLLGQLVLEHFLLRTPLARSKQLTGRVGRSRAGFSRLDH